MSLQDISLLIAFIYLLSTVFAVLKCKHMRVLPYFWLLAFNWLIFITFFIFGGLDSNLSLPMMAINFFNIVLAFFWWDKFREKRRKMRKTQEK